MGWYIINEKGDEMSHEAKIHEAQTKILRELLFVPDVNFAKLVTITGLDGDHAKFHIKRLVELGYIEKKDSKYGLSIKGKEYANKLDTDDNTIERQPKSSGMFLLHDKTTNKFLIQKRLKQPYYGFYNFYTGKIRWGESLENTAIRETLEETGLDSKNWEHRGIYHEIVRHTETGEVLEDKIFHYLYTASYSGTLLKKFEGGENFWMTLEEVRKQAPNIYESFEINASATNRNIGFIEKIVHVDKEF